MSKTLEATKAGERTQHTAGPWTSNEDGQIQCPNLNAYGNWIVATIGREMTPEDHANARLIAAAPELLDALKYIADTQLSLRQILEAARAAIAAAEGK
jgi:hypothetical protein